MKAKQLDEALERLEVLSDMYNDISSRAYESLDQKNTAKLKMRLLKKEMLLLNYKIDKMIHATT